MKYIVLAVVVILIMLADSIISFRTTSQRVSIQQQSSKLQRRRQQLSLADDSDNVDGIIDTASISKSVEELKADMKVSIEVADQSKIDAIQQRSIKPSRKVKTENFIDIDGDFLDGLKSKRSYISILTERFMQTIDDMQLTSAVKGSSEYRRLVNASPKEREADKAAGKQKIVILGSGWGSHAFLKTVDATKYDVTVISPRNYFTFTPMLAASAVGTVEFRSICEPIRNVNPLAEYLEAAAVGVDFDSKLISCTSIKCRGTSCDVADFTVPYDQLIIAVGATTNTFGIKGVREHCQFLKQAEDAVGLRKAIANSFERANIPGLDEQEIRDALSFVVVGAGPTGVEFTSELRDWVESEGRRYYGRLLQFVKITLVEAGDAVLAVFDKQLQDEAMKRLTERNTKLLEDGFIETEVVKVMLRSGVQEVTDSFISFSNGERLNYGFCLWAAGNGPIPFVLDCIEKVPLQKEMQSKARGRIATDRWLRMRGVDGVLTIGDCGFIDESPLPATAQVASQQGSYLGRLLSKGFQLTDYSANSPPVKKVPRERAEPAAGKEIDSDSLLYSSSSSGSSSINPSVGQQTLQQPTSSIRFASERIKIGKLGVTQIAEVSSDGEQVELEFAKPFQFLNLGVLAYIGASEALAQISVDETLIKGSGGIGFLLWRGIYWFKQVSWRNRVLVGLDWTKARLFGRDIGSL